MPQAIFVQNVESGEPAYFAGTREDYDAMISGVRNLVPGELDPFLRGEKNESVTLSVTMREMTEAEIAAIPDA